MNTTQTTQTTLIETVEDLTAALGEPDVFHTPGWTEEDGWLLTLKEAWLLGVEVR